MEENFDSVRALGSNKLRTVGEVQGFVAACTDSSAAIVEEAINLISESNTKGQFDDTVLKCLRLTLAEINAIHDTVVDSHIAGEYRYEDFSRALWATSDFLTIEGGSKI